MLLQLEIVLYKGYWKDAAELKQQHLEQCQKDLQAHVLVTGNSSI